jgi:antirestriction protein ArdC
MIVKVVDLDADRAKESGAKQGAPAAPTSQGRERGAEQPGRRNIILKRYYVFAAHRIEGMPDLAAPGEPEFDPIEKAESIMKAMVEKTGLKVLYGKKEACYVPAMDEVHRPAKKAFKSPYDLASVQLREISHATISDKRLARRDALGKRWGDEAYAVEELRAEISSAILSAELGIEMREAQRAKHMGNHVAYLQSWIKAIRNDPMAIFTAAKDADRMAEYVLGVERQQTAMAGHKEWVAEYGATPER